MFFEDEPDWLKKARTIPLYSTWESRQKFEREPMSDGSKVQRAPKQEEQ